VKTVRIFLYVVVLGCASLSTGCIDAVREGLTGGISSGLSAAIETTVSTILGGFLPGAGS